MNKANRLLTIKEIIQSKPIASQDELVLELRKRSFDVTQATLSRDLRELGVVRIHAEGGVRYALSVESEERKLKSLVGFEIVSVNCNEAMIVIRTLPGRAQGVASYIDSLHSPEILGTVAGDDTVLVLPSSTKKTQTVMNSIKEWMATRNA
ncbi:MAG: arginine repressor [Bacteroidota bacterium]|nr:arginine repressor [Bacteroidota bacterium]